MIDGQSQQQKLQALQNQLLEPVSLLASMKACRSLNCFFPQLLQKSLLDHPFFLRLLLLSDQSELH
jgi:hypothetical protein